jgi:hypothetical protein
MVEEAFTTIGHHQTEQDAKGEAEDQPDAYAEERPRQEARNDRRY